MQARRARTVTTAESVPPGPSRACERNDLLRGAPARQLERPALANPTGAVFGNQQLDVRRSNPVVGVKDQPSPRDRDRASAAAAGAAKGGGLSRFSPRPVFWLP